MKIRTSRLATPAICVAALLAVSAMLVSSPAAAHNTGHHHIPDPVALYQGYKKILKKIKLCESQGNYQSVNEASSELHEDGTTGSYGGYQIWPALWTETVLLWMPDYFKWAANYRPDYAYPIIQDLVAAVIWWRLGKIAWQHGGDCG